MLSVTPGLLFALCDTWVALDVGCCTASILNLTAISVDRFQLTKFMSLKMLIFNLQTVYKLFMSRDDLL